MTVSPPPPSGVSYPHHALAFVAEVAERMLSTIAEAKAKGLTQEQIVTLVTCMLTDPNHPKGTVDAQEHLAVLASLSAVLLVEKACQ